MDNKDSTSGVIASYRKRRQQSNVIFVYGAAGLLILAGLALLGIWLTGPSHPLQTIFATRTPTPTVTPTPTNTPIPTDTPTITPTGTTTPSLTPSAPFSYTVQEGDSLAAITAKFNLGDNGIGLIMLLNPYNASTATGIDPTTGIVYPGQQILLPNPGMPYPTPSPLPPNLPRGTILPYQVQAGDSLALIASKFNSTIDDIVKQNNLTDPNAIKVGETLKIPVNLVTPTATRPPTSTPRTPLPPATSTP